jgi:small acid-soluble spore protein A (major alpha-type SASP)
MNNTTRGNSNTSRSSKKSLEPLKYEIANEFGVELGADASARANGSVGGEITKRLVSYAKGQMGGSAK